MKKLVLFASDIVLLYGALALMVFTRYREQFQSQLDIHLVPFSFIFVIWIVVFYILNLYEPRVLRNNLGFYTSLLQAVITAGILSVLFFYLFPVEGIAPKTNLALFVFFFGIAEAGARSLFNEVIEKRFQRNVVIVGINPQSIELAQFLKNNPQLGYHLVCLIDIGGRQINELDSYPFRIIRGAEHIADIIKDQEATIIIVSPEAYQVQEIIDIFYRSLEYRADFFNLASFYEKTTGKIPLGAINQIWFLENITEGEKRLYELVKRIFDVVFAVILGTMTLALLPFIALLTELSSPGPIFYRQRRVGRAGKPFELIKFRTMIVNEPTGGAEGTTGAVWTQENDPRITRIGRILRKSRIDELPQFWNILKGNMSFVGPRSERPEFHDLLKQKVPFYEERYLIKPGLTGWAQLQKSYYSSVQDTIEKLQYDLYYIKNRSLILDLGILLKTVNVSLRQAGR